MEKNIVAASAEGDYEQVKEILDKQQVKANCVIEGRSALHGAAAHGHHRIVKALLKAGANPAQVNNLQRSALHLACIGGHHKVVQVLGEYLSAKNLDAVDIHQQSALHLAASNGEIECDEYLVDKGCDASLRDLRGRNCLHLACSGGDHWRVTRFLLSRDACKLADVDQSGRRPLHHAAHNNGMKCVKLLLDLDDNVNSCDVTMTSAHHLAASKNHLRIVKYLAKQGARLSNVDKYGRGCLHLAAKHDSLEVCHWLCEVGLQVDAVDEKGETALHYAAKQGRGEIANCLLQHGASLQLKNPKDEDAGTIAKCGGHPKLFQDVLQNKVRCRLCARQASTVEWELKHQPGVFKRYLQTAHEKYRPPPPFASASRVSSTSATEVKRKQTSTARKHDGVQVASHDGRFVTKFYGFHPKQLEKQTLDSV